jgi:hypothetical protein
MGYPQTHSPYFRHTQITNKTCTATPPKNRKARNVGIMGKTSSNYHPGNPSLSFWGVLSTGIQPIININVETNHRFLLNPPFLEKCQSKPWLFPPLFPWFSLSRRKAPGGG